MNWPSDAGGQTPRGRIAAGGGTNHFAWEMASFEQLPAMYRHLQAKGVEILRVRENTYSVGVHFNAPDGDGLEAYYEKPGGYRRAWEGQYTRQLLV